MAAKKKAPRKALGRKGATKKAAPRGRPSAVLSKAQRLERALQKNWSPSRVMVLSRIRDSASEIKEFLPTGIEVLDNYVISGGGLPVGRMSEIFGSEGCGKTSLLYGALGQVQRAGGVGVLADPELSFDYDRAEALGVDCDELLFLQPENLEDLCEQFKATLRFHKPADGPMLLGWDSIASTKSRKGLMVDANDRTPGEVARIMSEQLPNILQMLPGARAHLCMLNQIRHKIGQSFGADTTTPGGNAPKFYSSVRLQFFGGKAVKRDGEHIAKIVTIMALKNRKAPPFRKARVRYDYATGYNNSYSTIEHAKRMKVIQPREKGFTGKGKSGPKAHAEALERLGWSGSSDDEVEFEVG